MATVGERAAPTVAHWHDDSEIAALVIQHQGVTYVWTNDRATSEREVLAVGLWVARRVRDGTPFARRMRSAGA